MRCDLTCKAGAREEGESGYSEAEEGRQNVMEKEGMVQARDTPEDSPPSPAPLFPRTTRGLKIEEQEKPPVVGTQSFREGYINWRRTLPNCLTVS